jgi:hypothetical protein
MGFNMENTDVVNKKKASFRKCIVCGEKFLKKDLLRIVKNKDNEILMDPTQKLDGRGAYVCKSSECISLIKKKNALNRSFKNKVSDEIYDKFQEVLNE